jgi:hypothetical protein
MRVSFQRPGCITDAKIGTETTTLGYWPTGLLKQVRLPDSSYTLYTVRSDGGRSRALQFVFSPR